MGKVNLGNSWGNAANDLVYGYEDVPNACKIPPRKILSLSGGGVRGVVTLEALALLEEKTGKPICDLFDMIVGTSTGGIIALALARNKHTGQPAMSARELQKFYFENSEEIFESSMIRQVLSGKGMLFPKISPDSLKESLEKNFGTFKLSDLETPVSITAVNADNNELHIFRSGPSDPQKDFSLVDVGLATSAAPTYFPRHTASSVGGQSYTFIDGGIQKNNPVMVGYGDARRLFGDGKLLITSVGTGDNRQSDIKAWKKNADDVLLPARTLVDRILEGQEMADIKILSHFPDVEMVTINPRIDQDIEGLPEANRSLDASSKPNLRNLTTRSLLDLKQSELNPDSAISRLFKHLADANSCDVSTPPTAKLYVHPAAAQVQMTKSDVQQQMQYAL